MAHGETDGGVVEPIASIINFDTDKYPFCIVWTPIPVLTWFFPFIGHMGIALSNGVIRDFAGPYFVSEDNFAFGRPARYLQLTPYKVHNGGACEWDECVSKASVVYGTRMHNIFCDNCHSHVGFQLNSNINRIINLNVFLPFKYKKVGMALALMHYDNSSRWNMVRLALWMFFCGRHVRLWGMVRTWGPFIVIVIVCGMIGFYLSAGNTSRRG